MTIWHKLRFSDDGTYSFFFLTYERKHFGRTVFTKIEFVPNSIC